MVLTCATSILSPYPSISASVLKSVLKASVLVFFLQFGH